MEPCEIAQGASVVAPSDRPMSGVGDNRGPKKNGLGFRDENLPLAEPDAIQELPEEPPLPRATLGSFGGRPPPGRSLDATEASEPLGGEEEVTVGQPPDESRGSAMSMPKASARPLPMTAPSMSRRRDDGIDDESPESRIGTVLAGRYRLERVIAKGGMGRVYLATQLPLERQVAIKLLVNQRFDSEFRARFFLEASTCARLVHRHIVTVHDYGEADDGELFMAMEYLDGVPLSKVIQREVRLSSDRACKIALQVCRALRTAHKTGVVHRDLKPGNVIVLTDEDQDGNDFIKVLDFGLVKAFETGSLRIDELTKSGTWLGSPRYMAPEQIRCQAVDPRTDIYSLGVILFHMLAGRPPFIGANSMEVLEQHLRDKPPTLSDVLGGNDYAPELEVIIERCLKKEPAQRYQSMDELIGDLKASYRLITGVSIHTESTLPTFAEISDPSQPWTGGFDAVRGSGNGSLSAVPADTLAISQSSSRTGQRVTGTIRSPLDLLDRSSAGSRSSSGGVPPYDDASDSFALSRSGQSSMVVPPPASFRWVSVASMLVLVMLAGFFSVKLFGQRSPPTINVRVDSKPQGAEVLMDGRRLGTTPMIFPVEGAKPGSYRTFVVRKAGHEDIELSTQLQGEQVDLHAALVPLPPPVRPRSPPPQTRIEPVPNPVRPADAAAIEPPDSSRPAEAVEAARRSRGVETTSAARRSRASDGVQMPRRRRTKKTRRVAERLRRDSSRQVERPDPAEAAEKRSGRASRGRSGPAQPSNAKSEAEGQKKKNGSESVRERNRSLLVGDDNRVVEESDVPIVE